MNRKIIIYAHFAGNGNTEELRDWLIRQQVRELIYIAFPFGDCSDSSIRLSRYLNGQLAAERCSAIRFKSPFMLSYIKDFLYGLFWGVRYGKNSDGFFGGDNLLSLCGLLLRRWCRIKRIYYYMIDYTPRRYASRLLNAVYYWMDRFASERCDEIWVPAEETIQGRFIDGRLAPEKVNWRLVPYGTHEGQISLQDYRGSNRLVYMGGLFESKGVHRLVEIYTAVSRQCAGITSLDMIIIGAGPLEPLLRRQVKEQGLSERIRVTGYMENYQEVLSELVQGGVALAPYDSSDGNSFSFYADAGKLKVYIGCGLPVVATDVPPFMKEIAGCGAGRIALYDADDFAAQVEEVLNNYEIYRSSALALSKEYSWDSIFSRAFNIQETTCA